MVSGQVSGCMWWPGAGWSSNTQNKYCYISPPPSNNIMLQQQHQDHVGIFITFFDQKKQVSIIVENSTGIKLIHKQMTSRDDSPGTVASSTVVTDLPPMCPHVSWPLASSAPASMTRPLVRCEARVPETGPLPRSVWDRPPIPEVTGELTNSDTDHDPGDVIIMTTLYDLSSLPATFSMMASPSARNRRRQQAAGTEESNNNLRTISRICSLLWLSIIFCCHTLLPPSVGIFLFLNEAKYFYSGE